MAPLIQDCASPSCGRVCSSPDEIRALALPRRQDSSIVNNPTIPSPLHLREHRPASSLSLQGPSSSQEDHASATSTTDARSTSPNSAELQGHEAPSKTPDQFWFRCYAAFFALFTAGWADGLTGTILPHIKNDFNLSYMLSSLLFVTSTLGFALGVIMIEQVMCLLGRLQLTWNEFPSSPSSWYVRGTRKKTRVPSPAFTEKDTTGDKKYLPARARFRILVIASILHASFFILMGTATGLSNVLIAYFVASLGKAFLNGTVNAYVTISPKRPLGQLYACNSVGAFAAPLVCQTLLARDIPWSHFYLGSLVLSAINTTLLVLAFRPTRNDSIEERYSVSGGTHVDTQSNCIPADLTEVESQIVDRADTALSEKSLDSSSTSSSPPSLTGIRSRSCLRLMLRLRYVWAFSFFMSIYSGSETSTQGYMATYLLAVRASRSNYATNFSSTCSSLTFQNANPNTVGYVTSGFWGGMAITRFITGFASPYLSFTQRKHAIHIVLIFALSMHLCIWFINSVFANAFSTGVIGLLYGPVYPSVLALAVDSLPTEAHMLGMAIIAAFANLGSCPFSQAIFPFICGALSNLQGPKVLVYMTVSQTVTLVIIWAFFPAKMALKS
ncbi:MFS general substrate transporter [Sanghuangporus baumii]|uniref:MFS general substrate transporter n=1 Tax=Sanghuangporus baumii TaxID=108892 RepID=A0A9Q5HSR6_SANBA|nr:MFS general substrate transporter [Sanghuangporus baumii]